MDIKNFTYTPVVGMCRGKASGIIVVIPGCGVKKDKYLRDGYERMAMTPMQTHSLNVKVVDSAYDRDFEDTDALVTFREDIPVGVRTADCVPILMYAEDVNGVAAVHAGWKGTLGGIVDNTLDVLEDNGADPANLWVAFGPSISVDNYEVDADLAGRFVEAGFEKYVSHPGEDSGKPHLDLQGINIERLLRRGVRMEHISRNDDCTLECRNEKGEYLYPSYRRDNSTTDRILTAVMLLKDK